MQEAARASELMKAVQANNREILSSSKKAEAAELEENSHVKKLERSEISQQENANAEKRNTFNWSE